METILASIHAHGTIWALGSYFIFSNAVSALPSPASAASPWYRWLFDFSHLIAGNLTRIIATRYPQAGGFTTGNPAPPADGGGK